MPEPKCPFCLGTLGATAEEPCPTCRKAVTPEYYEISRRAAPVVGALVGFPQHGKTTFQTALTLTMDGLGRALEGAYLEYLDASTQEAVRRMWVQSARGHQPDATHELAPPLLLGFHQLPQLTDRAVVLYDTPGELFTRREDIAAALPPLRDVQTVWFLVSLTDLRQDREGNSLQALLQTYMAAMSRFSTAAQRRTVLVVYTKCDIVADLPADVRHYLADDPFQTVTLHDTPLTPDPLFDIRAYVAEMEKISNSLREYTKRIPTGLTLINMARDRGLDLQFCAVSALGESPNYQHNERVHESVRFRVQDPLLWTLALAEFGATSQPRAERRHCLILDPSREGGPVYEEQLGTKLWECANRLGNVGAFHLGYSRPIARTGRPVSLGPARENVARLIGQILEQEPSHSRALVLTNGPILDLEDYIGSTWRERLMVVSTNPSYQPRWHRFMLLREDDTPENLWDQLANDDL